MELKLDLHVHSRRSPDGCMDWDTLAARARAAGLDGLAVCDHDLPLTELPAMEGLLVIPGIEVSTDCGHLLGLFVTGPVPQRDLAGAAAEIHRQGGLAVLAHPFQRSRDAARLEPAAALADGMEVWNSRADRKIPEANALAAAFARDHGLRPFGGSDAHRPPEVGNGYTVVDAAERTLDAVREALVQGRILAAAGRRSPARYAARSQLTRRRRLGSSPLGYLKWAAFAVRCCAQDLWRRGE